MSPPNYSLLLIMICFWVAYWLVKRYLIDAVGGVSEERELRIRTADEEWAARHEEYELALQKVESRLDGALRQASQRRKQLRQEALGKRQELLEATHEKAESRLEAALKELAEAAEAARAELRASAHSLARELASRLLEREVGS